MGVFFGMICFGFFDIPIYLSPESVSEPRYAFRRDSSSFQST